MSEGHSISAVLAETPRTLALLRRQPAIDDAVLCAVENAGPREVVGAMGAVLQAFTAALGCPEVIAACLDEAAKKLPDDPGARVVLSVLRRSIAAPAASSGSGEG